MKQVHPNSLGLAALSIIEELFLHLDDSGQLSLEKTAVLLQKAINKTYAAGNAHSEEVEDIIRSMREDFLKIINSRSKE